MKISIIITVVLTVLAIQLTIVTNSYSSDREIKFVNKTGETVDDLHIEFTNRLTEWDDTKPHTFNSVRHDAGKNNHNFYGTPIPNDGSATMTFKLSSGDITINRWWWTKGGNAIEDGKRIGEIKADNFSNTLSFNGGPATGNGLVRVSCQGINAMFNYIPGAPPEQTAVMFLNFMHTNFNYGGINRVFLNQTAPRQICAESNVLGNPGEEIQIEILAMDLSQPLVLLESSLKKLNLTALIEGLYNQSLNKMKMDYATVQLRSSLPPYGIVDFSGTSLDSNGKGRFFFFNAQNNVPYWIVLEYKNGIQTWSYDGMNRMISNQMNYDFTTAAGKAFGNNQKQMGARYAEYSGDVDKNDVVDANDLSMVDNDAFNFASGYIQTDVDLSLITDASDYALVDNNAAQFVVTVTPAP